MWKNIKLEFINFTPLKICSLNIFKSLKDNMETNVAHYLVILWKQNIVDSYNELYVEHLQKYQLKQWKLILRYLLSYMSHFMDVISPKMKQFGFVLNKNGEKLAFCGDVPLKESLVPYVQGSDWMLHEAFCLYEEKDIFKPYEKEHSTVKDACELAEKIGIKNLILYHTEDTHMNDRKYLYTKEGKPYFSGNLYVPDDRDVFEIFS